MPTSVPEYAKDKVTILAWILDKRMSSVRILQVTYEEHTYEYTRIHTSDIRVTYGYIRVHTNTYE